MLSHVQTGAPLQPPTNQLNTETFTYLIECLEVGPAQTGTALAAPHVLYLIVTSGQMGHGHLANPAPHEDLCVQNLEAWFCKVFRQMGTTDKSESRHRHGGTVIDV